MAWVVIGGHGASAIALAWTAVSLIKTAPGGSDATLPGIIAAPTGTLSGARALGGAAAATTAPAGNAPTGAGMVKGDEAGVIAGVAYPAGWV
jgi:hypothetical protein